MNLVPVKRREIGATHVETVNAFDLLATLSTLEGVRNALRVPDVPMQGLPTAAGRIRDELDDLRASMDEIRLLLDMPGATTAEVVRELERVCG